MIEHIQVIPDKCRACRRCEVACIAAHHGMTFKEAMKHRDVLVSRVQVVKAEGFKTTVRCHQCNPAPCCNICPISRLCRFCRNRLKYFFKFRSYHYSRSRDIRIFGIFQFIIILDIFKIFGHKS